MTSRRPTLFWLLPLAITLLPGCGGVQTRSVRRPLIATAEEGSEARAETAPERPGAFEARVMFYNVLYEYQQVPRADGSFPPWVCQSYPYVVDHPELRWEQRFGAIAATIEREAPDILGLAEMRGGVPVSTEPNTPDPACDPSDGPPVIRDMTDWMRNGGDYRYRWVSVFDVPPASVVPVPGEEARWPGSSCRADMSNDGCQHYDPRTDRRSTKTFVAYRPDRFELSEAGAFELTTQAPEERRFAPWARLRERASGLDTVAVVVHLDAFSAEHRAAAAERIVAFVEAQRPTPVVVMGDFNARAGDPGDPTYETLTGGPLVDVFTLRGEQPARGSVVRFRLAPGAQPWRRQEPCWPSDRPGEGRGHVGAIEVTPSEDRVDYIFTTEATEVLRAEIPSPVEQTITVREETRVVHPSDHLPVTTTIRVAAP